MAITFVAAGTAFSRIGAGNNFTLNCPAGVANGDMMLAAICFDSEGALRTVTPPAGWTFLRSSRGADDGRENQISILYRVATASESSSWSGTLSSSSTTLCTATVVAYRGVQQLGASNASASGVATSLATATVNNVAANSWRVVVGSYTSATTNYTISSNEVLREVLFAADDTGSTGACQAAIWDSNAGIATGNTSRTVSRSASWSVASSVILLLEPTTGTPASGVWSSTLGAVSSTSSGDVTDSGTVSATTPSVSATGAGYGQPPVGTGTMDATTPSLTSSMAGNLPVTGTMDAQVLPSINFQGETRVFGVRVITIEADDRTIVVESRGVAD